MRRILLDMLTYCRPANSPTCLEFEQRFLLPLGATRDAHGNYHVCTDATSRVLWSAHTDTVADSGGRQRVSYDAATGIVQLSKHARRHKRNCLGADNTAGVYLLTEMIKAGVPGYYIFHYAEEHGCLGSYELADTNGDWLRQRFDYAIAFDRRGTAEVITHQRARRMASDTCGLTLAEWLNAGTGFQYALSDKGIYTDTAEYPDYIPECFNVSVGTADEHRQHETLNVRHVLALRDRLCSHALPTLPVVRVAEPEPITYRQFSWPPDDWQADHWQLVKGIGTDGKETSYWEVIPPPAPTDDLEELSDPASEFYGWTDDDADHYLSPSERYRYETDKARQRERGIYLDPVQADIQHFLRRQGKG